jgi:hypothetical protein
MCGILQMVIFSCTQKHTPGNDEHALACSALPKSLPTTILARTNYLHFN